MRVFAHVFLSMCGPSLPSVTSLCPDRPVHITYSDPPYSCFNTFFTIDMQSAAFLKLFEALAEGCEVFKANETAHAIGKAILTLRACLLQLS